MSRILLIDDDEHLGPPLAQYFQRFGLVLEQAHTPSEWQPVEGAPTQPQHYELVSIAQYRQLTHPIRGRVLMALADRGGTVAEIAEQLGIKPTSLYHHFNLLLHDELIFVSHTRRVGLVVEHRYTTVARSVSLPAAIAQSASPQDLVAINTTSFDLAKATMLHAYRRGLVGPHESTTAGFDLRRLMLTTDERADFLTDLRALLDRYSERSTDGAEPFEIFYSAQPAQPPSP